MYNSDLSSHGICDICSNIGISFRFTIQIPPKGIVRCSVAKSKLILYQILGESASSALAVVIVDFLFVYIGCYLLNVQASKQAVDIVAYSGYKFVGYVLRSIIRPL